MSLESIPLAVILFAIGLLALFIRTYVKSTVQESVKNQFAREREERRQDFEEQIERMRQEFEREMKKQ